MRTNQKLQLNERTDFSKTILLIETRFQKDQ